MAHKTRINGTNYDIKGGKTLINSTLYGIKIGKTCINGTIYDISFGHKWQKWNVSQQSRYSYNTSTSKSMTGNTVLFSSYTFNYNDGLFYGSGPTYASRVSGYHSGYMTGASGASHAGEPSGHMTYSSYWTTLLTGSGIYIWETEKTVTDYTSCTITEYVKGSTYYGDVTNNNPNAYPANGKHTDGYWYLKIY